MRLCLLLIALLLAVPAAAFPMQPPIVGDWLTEGGDGVIQIAPCIAGFCGRIVGITRDPGEPMPHDWRGEQQCDLTILTVDPTPDDGVWHGAITDPRNGTAYHAQLRLDPSGQLLMRGYVGIPLLGQTQTWQRFIGRFGPECAFVKGNGPRGAPPDTTH